MTIGEMLLAAILPGIVTWRIIFRWSIDKEKLTWSNFWESWWWANLAFCFWPIVAIGVIVLGTLDAIESIDIEKAIWICGGYSHKEKKAKKVLAK